MKRIGEIFPERGSLLATLIVRLTATTFFLTFAIVAWLLIELDLHVDTIRDRSLIGQAEDVARHIVKTSEGTFELRLPPGLAEGYGNPRSGFYYQVRDRSGAVVFSSAGGAAPLDHGRVGTESTEKP